jgi:hypothetical protein
LDAVELYKNGLTPEYPIILGKQGEDNVTRLKFVFPVIGDGATNPIDPKQLSYRVEFYYDNGAVAFISPSLSPLGDEEETYIEYMVESGALQVAGTGKMDVIGVDVQNLVVWKSVTIAFQVVEELAIDDQSIPELPEWVVQLETLQVSVVDARDAIVALTTDIQDKLTRGEFKGDPGVGIAPGGTVGQVLTKRSDAAYDTEWKSPGDYVIPTEGIHNQMLDRSSANKIDILHDDMHNGAIGETKLCHTGDDKIVITPEDLDNEYLKDLAGAEIDTDAVSGIGAGFNFNNKGTFQKDTEGNTRVKQGELDNGMFGLHTVTADGQTTIDYTDSGIWRNGVPAYVDKAQFDNTVIELRNGNGNHLYFTTAEPTGTAELPLLAGDVWYDTDDNYKPYHYNGETWNEVQFDAGDILQAGTITASLIAVAELVALIFSANTAFIENGQIRNLVADVISGGTLNMSNITVINLLADMIKGGTLTIGGNAASASYNGKISLLNSNGATIGTIDRNGIAFTLGDGIPAFSIQSERHSVVVDASGTVVKDYYLPAEVEVRANGDRVVGRWMKADINGHSSGYIIDRPIGGGQYEYGIMHIEFSVEPGGVFAQNNLDNNKTLRIETQRIEMRDNGNITEITPTTMKITGNPVLTTADIPGIKQWQEIFNGSIAPGSNCDLSIAERAGYSEFRFVFQKGTGYYVTVHAIAGFISYQSAGLPGTTTGERASIGSQSGWSIPNASTTGVNLVRVFAR